ncbi:ATP-binding protein [soil metagenome]
MAALPRQGISRRLSSVVKARMADEPVVLLQGPRTVGKSRLLATLANAEAGDLIDLDDLASRAAAAADPAFLVRSTGCVFIDEYQHVPQLLDAIKAELNTDLRPGRFVLAGSTRHDALPTAAQALTGRLHRIDVLPFSQGELAGTVEHFLEDLFDDRQHFVKGELSSESRQSYIRRIVRGGFPLALARTSDGARGRWFDDYVELTLERDVAELANLRRRAVMPRFVERMAAQTAQVLNVNAASAATGVDWRTGELYLKLLESVFLVHRLPAWGSTLRARATSKPKVHVVDSGVAARLLRLTPDRLAGRDPAAMSELGHLLETFVVGEIRKQASWMDGIVGLGHWRTSDGDEVDLIVERDDGSIVALEVKTSSRVTGADLRSLGKLRDAAGPRFVAGVALHLGERSYTYSDRIHVVPVDRIWAP